MLSSTQLSSSYDIDAANQLFQQLSISLDSKFVKHKHAIAKPKLKRLLKIKYSSNVSSASFCSRCKREAKHEPSSLPEKEVEVKKEKKVAFATFSCPIESKGKAVEERLNGLPNNLKSEDNEDWCEDEDVPLSESVPNFQTVFFARRPSIIGNNGFWLPQYSSREIPETPSSTTVEAKQSENVLPNDSTNSNQNQDEQEAHLQLITVGVTEFLKSIFQQTTKQKVKVLKVVELIDGTIGTLTDQHFFQCQMDNTSSYSILEAVALKDVQRVFVNDSCLMVVLEIDRASTLNEFKEFVPGHPEKTESLVSLMVYALSRIRNFLPDVTRLPTHLVPTCATLQTWLLEQNENVLYEGIVAVENVSFLDHELLDENFMMRTSDNGQFHPVRIMLRSGLIMTICNGGCEPNRCKYTISLELKEEITGIKRESHPWPNCICISTENTVITLSSSCMASVDDLLDKLYFVIQSKSDNSVREHAIVLVTQFYLQCFKLNRDKQTICGFPLLNLELKMDRDSCILDSQGVEAEDTDIMYLQSRWKLTFSNPDETMKFLTAASQNNY